MTPNKFFDTIAIKRPKISKLGTIKCDTVEVTPIVFGGRLYRLENIESSRRNESSDLDVNFSRFVDVETNTALAGFAYGYAYSAAFTDNGVMYVSASKREGVFPDGDGYIDIFRSTDLENFEKCGHIEFPGMLAFNTGICKKDGKFILLTEVNKPLGFTFRFSESTDMENWSTLPFEYHFQDGRYAGGPAIYTLDNDPYYYVFYVEAQPGGGQFTNCLARSIDLKKWEYSPINPILMYNEYEDKKIANPFLTERELTRIERALDVNNSDLEMCEYNGRTIIYYSWGNQLGNEYLAEACFEGSMAELLHGFFDI